MTLLYAIAAGGIILSAMVVAVSVWSFRALARQGRLDREYVRRRGWLDAYLLLAWTLLLVSSAGLLGMRRWGASGVLAALGAVLAWAVVAAALRLRTLREFGKDHPVRWPSAVVGHAVIVLLIAAAIFGLSRYFDSAAVREVLK